ncbi:hypothetical protein [Phenylobacterium sp.]|jgi:hypothetical protein|uniref:hypothetical protein n=1 Tax=Phenylobacterium sp. TaxID=1871053 RepID=UPI002F9415B0
MPRRPKSRRPHGGDTFDRAPLGRVFSVRRETWRIDEDPRSTPPDVAIVASRRTAADAADLAREAAAAFRKRGFHKPSRSWWGVEDGWFHRFRVQGPTARTTAVAVALGVTAAAVFLVRRNRRRAPDED